MKSKFLLYVLMILSISCSNKKTVNQKQTKGDKTEKPNIIIILVDDAGYVDFGFMGSPDLKTPYIDSLALSGVKFTDAHVSASVCAPSRAGLITGQYQQRFGFEANHTGDVNSGDIGLAKDVKTMASVFKDNNYNTIAIGKWHLGAKEYNHPNNRGFDEFYGFLAGGRSYFPMENPSTEHMLQFNGERVEFDDYLTDVLGQKSVDYVGENKDKPFFMYLSYNAVHTPMHAKESDLNKFENHPRQTLAAMTWSMDENVGKLTSKLKDLGIFDNTLIFFLSDNGGAHNNDSSSGPLKGFKGNEFEGGHRVPFVMTWPKKIKPNQTFEGLSSSLDIFQTALAAANIQKPEDIILDGVNLLPYLNSDKSKNPHQKLFWRKLEESAARVDNYKLVSLDTFDSTLYDLSVDLGETQNISSQDTIKFNELMKHYKDWEEEMMKPLWREGQAWENITYHIQKRLMQNKPVLYKSPSEKKKYSKHNDAK